MSQQLKNLLDKGGRISVQDLGAGGAVKSARIAGITLPPLEERGDDTRSHDIAAGLLNLANGFRVAEGEVGGAITFVPNGTGEQVRFNFPRAAASGLPLAQRKALFGTVSL